VILHANCLAHCLEHVKGFHLYFLHETDGICTDGSLHKLTLTSQPVYLSPCLLSMFLWTLATVMFPTRCLPHGQEHYMKGDANRHLCFLSKCLDFTNNFKSSHIFHQYLAQFPSHGDRRVLYYILTMSRQNCALFLHCLLISFISGLGILNTE
jgi:hypothetical protein